MTKAEERLDEVFAYLDGELDEDARLRFEAELAADPELMGEVERLVDADGLLLAGMRASARREAAGGSERTGGSTPVIPFRRLRPLLALAAAVVVGTSLWLLLTPDPVRPLTVQLAVLPNEQSLAKQAERLGLDLPLPPGHGTRGESDEPTPNDEYAAAANALEAERVEDALAAPAAETVAGYFTLALRVDEPCSAVVVLLFDEPDFDGATNALAFPAEEAWSEASGRLEPGLTTLPRALFDAGAGDLYDPGFLVPLGVGGVTAVVATRREPLDEALRRGLTQVLAAQAPGQAQLTTWLDERDFACFTVRVVEPR